MTKGQFLSAMAPLEVNYRQQLTKPLLTMWWSQFQHVLPDEFRDALVAHVQSQPFFPTIAQMRDALGMNTRTTLADAGAAFARLTTGRAPKYDPHRGDYWPLENVLTDLGPQALAAFMAAGGTSTFRDRTDRNIDFLRRDFMKAWEEYAKNPTPPERLLPASTAPRGLAPASASLPRLMSGTPETP